MTENYKMPVKLQRHKTGGWLYCKAYDEKLLELKREMPRTKGSILRLMAREHADRVIGQKNIDNRKVEEEAIRKWREERREQKDEVEKTE